MSKRERVQVFFTEPSLTRQEFKQECDLGYILKRFSNSAEGLSELLRGTAGAQFFDVSAVPDYRESLDIVRKGQERFQALPKNIRDFFRDDPLRFVEFCSDPKNLDTLRKLGLAKSEKVFPLQGKNDRGSDARSVGVGEVGTVPLDPTVPGDTKLR